MYTYIYICKSIYLSIYLYIYIHTSYVTIVKLQLCPFSTFVPWGPDGPPSPMDWVTGRWLGIWTHGYYTGICLLDCLMFTGMIVWKKYGFFRTFEQIVSNQLANHPNPMAHLSRRDFLPKLPFGWALTFH